MVKDKIMKPEETNSKEAQQPLIANADEIEEYTKLGFVAAFEGFC